MNNNPSPENPGTSPVNELGRQQPPRPGDPVAPLINPTSLRPVSLFDSRRNIRAADRNAVRITSHFKKPDAVASKGAAIVLQR
jgi:hypothetical protein